MSQSYQQQLDEKQQRIEQQFSPFHIPRLEVFPSTENHFRMRAEFRIWHTEDDIFYAMFEKNETGHKKVIRIDDFPIATQAITTLMPILRESIKANPTLSHRIFGVDFLATLKGEMLVTLIYHRQLDEAWQIEAEKLQQHLNIKIIGRSRGQKLTLSDDFVLENFTVNDKTFVYKQIENGFSQPNAKVCEKMLTWACDVAQQVDNSKDLLELYCGNGNFTLPLSQKFRKVLATELAKSSVQAAEWNIAQNKIDNIQIARLSAEEFTQAFDQAREFRRLKQQNIQISDYDFDTIFVDPPRAGIDDETLKLVARFNHIIYISCNPDTLYDNLKQLTQTHEIVRFALFDQFPYTHHIESGVFLRKETT